MKKYNIKLIGCDDSTYIPIELTEEQVEFVKKLCTLSQEISELSCQPIMQMEEIE